MWTELFGLGMFTVAVWDEPAQHHGDIFSGTARGQGNRQEAFF